MQVGWLGVLRTSFLKDDGSEFLDIYALCKLDSECWNNPDGDECAETKVGRLL